MFKIHFSAVSLAALQQLDPGIIELQKRVELFKIVIIASVFVIVVLLLVAILQRVSIARLKRVASESQRVPVKRVKKRNSISGIQHVKLPDPGIVFRFSAPDRGSGDKTITIGATTGSIKTYSTEIIDNHLSIRLRAIAAAAGTHGEDIREEYIVDLSRGGNALVCYPGEGFFRPIGDSERIYIMNGDDPAGGNSLPVIEPGDPLRVRLGGILDENSKFACGYFEFHIFNREYRDEAAGMASVRKSFLVRLYRIYPGYDLSRPDDNGLYPMIEPYRTAE